MQESVKFQIRGNVAISGAWLLMVIMLVTASPLQAQLIKLPFQGLVLTGKLERSGTAPAAGVAEPALVLMIHGGLAHRDMEIMVHLRSLLQERGYSTLAINLSLGINERQGMFDCTQVHRHRHNDAVAEINAWMAWLHSNGYQKIILLGHSRGGGQAAWFAYENASAGLQALVLLAAQTRENGAHGYERRYQVPLAPILDKARELERRRQGQHLLAPVNILFCRNSRASAESFLSYYGTDWRLDTPSILSKLKVPTLVLVAGDDQLVPDLEQRVKALAPSPNLVIAVIEGAGHFFRDLFAEDAMDIMDEFLRALDGK